MPDSLAFRNQCSGTVRDNKLVQDRLMELDGPVKLKYRGGAAGAGAGADGGEGDKGRRNHNNWQKTIKTLNQRSISC